MSKKAVLTQSKFLIPFRQSAAGNKCTAAKKSRWHFVLITVVTIFGSMWATNTIAKQFTIENANTKLVGEIYYLQASLKYTLSSEALNALENGIPLILVLDIEVIKPRRYMWDEEIATLEQRYEIRYHALTDQYMLANKNSGSQYIYPTLDSALSTLEHIDDLPLIDAHLLNDDDHYMVQVRSRLDFESLPVPLRMKAYFSGDWWLSSGWYSWDL